MVFASYGFDLSRQGRWSGEAAMFVCLFVSDAFLIIGSFVWSGYNFSMVLLVIAWCCLSERSWLSLKNSYDRTIFLTFVP